LNAPQNFVSENSNADNRTQKAAAITAAADKPVKRAETSSMQVNLLCWLHLAAMYLFLEQIICSPPPAKMLKLTRSLGGVIRMSGELALSWGWCCMD